MPSCEHGLDDGVDLVRALLADEVGDGVVVDEELVGRNETAGDARNQALGEYAGERAASWMRIWSCWSDGNESMMRSDGLGGVVGVEGREDEVAGLGGSHGRGDGLDVAHLADHTDVDVLAEHGVQGIGEIRRVDADLALVDDGASLTRRDIRSDLRWSGCARSGSD